MIYIKIRLIPELLGYQYIAENVELMEIVLRWIKPQFEYYT